MDISVEKKDGKARINIGGVVNDTNYKEILTIFRKLLEEGEDHFIVDLGDVSYIDSSGLGVLINCYKETESKNATFEIDNVSDDIARIFQLTHLTKFFSLECQAGCLSQTAFASVPLESIAFGSAMSRATTTVLASVYVNAMSYLHTKNNKRTAFRQWSCPLALTSCTLLHNTLYYPESRGGYNSREAK